MRKAWLFSGRALRALAREVAASAGIPLGRAEVSHFPDGELRVQVKEDVGGDHVFLVQSTSSSEAAVELLLLADALKRCQPRRLDLIVPYFGYGRQERRTGQSPVSAQVMARMLNHSGADALVTLELHAPMISNFITLPHLQLHTARLFADWIRGQAAENKQIVVVSPDQGGGGRARQLNRALGTGRPVTVLEKRRLAPERCYVAAGGSSVDLAGRQAILVDDIVSTGATLIQAAQWVADQGAAPIWACVTHLVASPHELGRRLAHSSIERLLVSNSLPWPEIPTGCRIQMITLAPLLAPVVLRLSQPSWVPTWARSIGQQLARAAGWLPNSLSESAAERPGANLLQRLGSLVSQ